MDFSHWGKAFSGSAGIIAWVMGFHESRKLSWLLPVLQTVQPWVVERGACNLRNNSSKVEIEIKIIYPSYSIL